MEGFYALSKTSRARYRALSSVARVAALGLLLGSGLVAGAQERPKGPDSPLDTILKTRIWADVPDAKDFVRESRPSSDSLDYQPTHGSGPEHRAALRTKSELEAMQSELESASVRNQKKAGRPAQIAGSRKAPSGKAVAN